jgi:hypothetical protein
MIPRLPNPPLHSSIADIAEAELIKRLVANPLDRESLFGVRGMPDHPSVLLSVDLQSAPGRFEGDVDILLVDPGLPQQATAIEVKRIKVGRTAFASGRPNKLREYGRAVRQADRLAEVGFAQVYLYAFVVVDSRYQNAGRYTYDGMTPELDAVVQNCISVKDLDDAVGVVVHEHVQPMDHPPLELGASGVQLVRLAAPRTQPGELTEWVTRLLERGAA